MPIDYDEAQKILEAIFNSVEANMLQRVVPKVDEKVRDACDVIFKSHTQAYREVLLGCAIARIQDKSINIRQPYVEQGTNAFSGRTFFNTKIAPNGIEDYLFFVKSAALAEEARQQAHQYFAQGHEINFLEIKNWILMSLATTGKQGRGIFNKVLVNLVDAPDIPKTIKVNWNEMIGQIVAGQN